MVEDYLCQLYQNMSIMGVMSEHKYVVCAPRFFLGLLLCVIVIYLTFQQSLNIPFVTPVCYLKV